MSATLSLLGSETRSGRLLLLSAAAWRRLVVLVVCRRDGGRGRAGAIRGTRGPNGLTPARRRRSTWAKPRQGPRRCCDRRTIRERKWSFLMARLFTFGELGVGLGTLALGRRARRTSATVGQNSQPRVSSKVQRAAQRLGGPQPRYGSEAREEVGRIGRESLVRELQRSIATRGSWTSRGTST